MEGAYNPDELLWVVVVGGLAMAYMAWGIGANDVANAFGPAFGAKCITVRQACCIAGVCEAAGAILMGSTVSDTIRKGMMSVSLYEGDDGRVLILIGMTSVLIAAATWLLLASRLGLPVSTTHSAVGGVIAIAITSKGYGSVKWSKVGMIVASWFISPVMSGFVGCIVFLAVHHLVLKHSNSCHRARLAAPVFVFMVTFIVALFTIYKGGKGLGLHKTSFAVAIGISAAIGILFAAISYPFVKWWAAKVAKAYVAKEDIPKGDPSQGEKQGTDPAVGTSEVAKPANADVEKAPEVDVMVAEDAGAAKDPALDPLTNQIFTGLTVIMAAFFSLAHGANDVANSVGPFGAVLAAYNGPLEKKSETPIWVFVIAGAMITVGLATYGIHVMNTIGTKITEVTAPKAFCINFSATLVVLLATRLGIPISTTHASVGAVVGVGLAGGVKNVDWKIMAKVLTSWIMTLPIVAITAAGIFATLLPTVVSVPFATSVAAS